MRLKKTTENEYISYLNNDYYDVYNLLYNSKISSQLLIELFERKLLEKIIESYSSVSYYIIVVEEC